MKIVEMKNRWKNKEDGAKLTRDVVRSAAVEGQRIYELGSTWQKDAADAVLTPSPSEIT